MGRKKIEIRRITNDRVRNATLTKRKRGLLKKAMELSILCDCQIALTIITRDKRIIQYSNSNPEDVMRACNEGSLRFSSFSNEDYRPMFLKKNASDSDSKSTTTGNSLLEERELTSDPREIDMQMYSWELLPIHGN